MRLERLAGIFHGFLRQVSVSFRDSGILECRIFNEMDDFLDLKKLRPALGEAGRARSVGTGRGGDVTGRVTLFAYRVSYRSRALAVAIAGRLSPSETQTLGSLCDCRLTKR